MSSKSERRDKLKPLRNNRQVGSQNPNTEPKNPFSEFSKSDKSFKFNLNGRVEAKEDKSRPSSVTAPKLPAVDAKNEPKNVFNVKFDFKNKCTNRTLQQEQRKQPEMVDTSQKNFSEYFKTMNTKNENLQFRASNIDKKNTNLKEELSELKTRKQLWRDVGIKYKNLYEELIEEKKKINCESAWPINLFPGFCWNSAQLEDQSRMNDRIEKLGEELISKQNEIDFLLSDNRMLRDSLLKKEIWAAEQIDLKQCEIDRLLADIKVLQDSLLDKEIRAAEQIDSKECEIDRLLADIKDLQDIITEKEAMASEANNQRNKNDETNEEQIQKVENATTMYAKRIFVEIFYLNVIVTIYVIFDCVRNFF